METPIVPMRPVPLHATSLQMAAPPEEQHSVFVLRGFLNRALDEAYTASCENMIGGRPIYWSSNKSHFIYFQRAELRWVISPRYNGDGDMDLLAHVLRGEMRGIAFENGGSNTWQEFFNGNWHPVTIQFSKLVAEGTVGAPLVKNVELPTATSSLAPSRTYNIERNKRPLASSTAQQAAPTRQPQKEGVAIVVCDGFSTQRLNTTYKVDRELAIGGRATYWDSEREYFLYYQLSLKRWAISCRNAYGEDLLLDAQRGGTRGLAYEADKEKGGTRWSEFFGDSWQTIEPRVQKLNAAGELSAIAAASKVVVPQTQPRDALVPQTRPREPLIAIKIEDATPTVPERNLREAETPVPTMPLSSLGAVVGTSGTGQIQIAARPRPAEGSQLGHVKPKQNDAQEAAAQKDEAQTEELTEDSSSECDKPKSSGPQKKDNKEKKDSSDESDEPKTSRSRKKDKKEKKGTSDESDKPKSSGPQKKDKKDKKDSSAESDEPKTSRSWKKDKKEKKGSSDESDAPKTSRSRKKDKKEKKDSSAESADAKELKKQGKKEKKHKKEKKEKKHRRKKELEERLRRELRKELQEKTRRAGGRFGKRNKGKEGSKEGRAAKERKSRKRNCSEEPAELHTQKKAAKEASASSDAAAASSKTTHKGTEKVKGRRAKSEPSQRLRKRWPREIADAWPTREIRV